MLGLVVSIIIILIIYIALSSKITSLSNEVSRLRQIILELAPQKNIPAPKEAQTVLRDEKVSPLEVQVEAKTQNQIKDEVELPDFLPMLLKDWPIKIGGFLVFLALIWFVSYAFINDWIGPVGRVLIGYIVASCFIIASLIYMKKQHLLSYILLSFGAAGALGVTYAAQEFYGFFTPFLAILIMSLITLMVGVVSVKSNSKFLAYVALILSSVAPLLSGSDEVKYLGLYLYLTVLCLGMLLIVALKGWRSLSVATFSIIALYTLVPLIVSASEEQHLLLSFAFAFALIFFVSNVATIVVTRKSTIFDLILGSCNSLLLLGYISAFVPEEWRSLTVLLVIAFIIIALFLLYKFTKLPYPMYVYSAVTLVFFAAILTYQLETPYLFIGYALEVLIAEVVTLMLTKNIKLISIVSSLFFIPAVLSLMCFELDSWENSIPTDNFLTLVSMALASIVIGLSFYTLPLREVKKASMLVMVLLSIGIIYFLVLIWLCTHAIAENFDTASAISLIVYTIIGVSTYLVGSLSRTKVAKAFGSILLALVLLEIFLFEIWKMAVGGKIVTFFVIGTLFILTTLFEKSLRTN